MSNLVDLWSESQASLIGDDAQPALTITNSSTGAGLQTNRLVATSAATVAQLNTDGTILAANATIAKVNLAGASRASGAVFALKADAFVSAVSLIFAASANWAGMGAIRVVKTDGTFGWIPVLPDGQVTAAAV